VRVSVKDGPPLVNAGLRRMFLQHPGRVELVEWRLDVVSSGRLDVVLVDRAVDSGAALERLDRVVATTTAKVVPFVWEIDAEEVADAIAAGAAGYLWKGLEAHELVDALEEICWGEPLPRPEQSQRYRHLMDEFGLSKREFEVLTLIARGVSNQEIADSAFLSINSVKSYIRGAYRKIGVTRRAQAVSWALHHGLDPTPASGEVPTGRPR
jgi:NarL family two-component system response regulator LiaR